MSGQILDGKLVSEKLLDEIAKKISKRTQKGHKAPGLAVVLVGDNPASEIYVRNKVRACDKVGINSKSYKLPRTVSETELFHLIDELNEDENIHGILVQLPLPKHINETHVTNRIHPNKDVDGFHAENVGRLALRQPGLRPCTPRGVMTLLHEYKIIPKSKHCVIVGASNIVGRPLLLEMLYHGATVTCCHRFTKDLEKHVRSADILCVAIGKTGIVKSNWIPKDCIVVDIAINRNENGKICGDVEFDEIKDKVAMITPVPGGVGPMTVATLMQNTYEASLL
ncbi:MAG TPA: bifunctional methylenetetrahydrofolate dehydrogenase/methenyltetrahydrofolate cyclohydrolase FolD [Gammaproteobacteria bacterium]|nr:bifunctional methylenetetrahydrofolate dehydrogenase/methenyltetrahydrofolate cyclohydrolase FolD [Xanthomonadales bacterium]MCB1593984.1 bifunctional methylenetetrahydrofolate dehydrogenase/methenyltetrahydrofolate cyclohydrolase FolD [Xanthomonadales bacterium]HOP22572.1 bifunctional methylenetetrahydrofolate dehydrogenase/methenyltetrahydrofolate cyclohydrolase FolD [Gammaproteobacteria bacterium]HPI95615.1 bifunctional methylenetetrahydrofolate dehydrogenase/methenyltetrahydrofolate cyclo